MKKNIKAMPDFALWAQENGFKSLAFNFFDPTGRGESIISEFASLDDAKNLYFKLFNLIKTGKIFLARQKQKMAQ